MKKIIYDFGSNNGDDIPYYLHKADRVIAIEANPVLCKLIQSKFQLEIQEKRLVIECCVVTNKDTEKDVPFYIHKKHHCLSQFPKPKRKKKFQKVFLPSQSVHQIILKHGAPYYIKIDLEFFDKEVLTELFKFNIYPPYISAEYKSPEIFALLYAYGRYKKYKLIDGKSIPDVYSDHTIASHTGNLNYSFPFHSAGPFGDDIQGNWMSTYRFMRLLLSKDIGWRDVHATFMQGIKQRKPSTKYRVISYFQYQFIKGLFSLMEYKNQFKNNTTLTL